MIYKETEKQLNSEGLIRKCPVDFRSINNLVKRAKEDLETTKRNMSYDEECAYNYAYNAMLRSGIALMYSKGYRPEIKSKHLTVVMFAGALLGDEYKKLINDYNFMRRKRNKFVYEPDIPCSRKEAEDALKTAENFVKLISHLVKKENPQQEFDF